MAMRQELTTDSRPTRSRRRRQAGNVAVELALALPFLLLIIAGIVDLGMLYWEKHVLTNAAREGARAASKAGSEGAAAMTTAQVMSVVQSYLNKFNLKNPDGSALTLTNGGTFLYQWNTGSSPLQLWVELHDIPVQLMLLPNIQALYGGGGSSSPVLLTTRTTMAAEWSTAPTP
jgi:hypothetical protein